MRKKIFAMVILLALGAFFLLGLQGYSTMALVCTAAAGVIGFYTFVPKLFKKSKAVIRIFTILLVLFLVAVGITEGFIIHAARGNPEEPAEYVLVLGAKVNKHGPSLALRNRIDAAYDYLTAHPGCTAILSGGQGSDEPMTEAKCMYDELVAMGIDPQRLWLEDKATSTWENLQFSLNLIEEKTGTRPTELGVLSSEYHLFRASLFTKACGAEFVGIPAHTTRLSQMINHFMREVAGVWHYILLGGQYHD